MNLTMSVEMTLVLFLLSSGFSHFTVGNHLRSFHISKPEQKWSESLNYCNKSGESLVTLYDEEDRDFTKQFSIANAWLGLKKSRNSTWSNDVPVTFNNTSVNVTKGEQICVAIDNTTWTGYNCSERKPFMCYRGSNYTLIESDKSWCQALQHCRSHFDNLVSISNETQNQNAIEAGKNTSFWIGLMLDEWEWQDGSCSSFREWSSLTYPQTDDMTVTQFNHVLFPMMKSKRDNAVCPFCSKGVMRIRVIQQNSTWEQAFNYCKAHHTGPLWINDQEDQNAVQQWLTHGTDVSGPFWIGLRQSRVFGFWIWSDSMVDYSNWKNDTTPEIPMSHHCGAIDKAGNWSDVDCLRQLPFLCEEEIVFMNKSRGGQ